MTTKPRIYLSSPHMGSDELKLVQDAFATNWIAPLGPHVDAFEKEFTELLSGGWPQKGTKSTKTEGMHAAALASGTAALHLAMCWLNLQPGDEVICSSLTFSASVNPVLYERATPVFVDSDERSWNMDPSLLAEAVEEGIRRGKKPKAVILVHLYGQSADIDPIAATCARHGIPLIEDAAEALGAVYFGHEKAQKSTKTESTPSSVLRPLSSVLWNSAWHRRALRDFFLQRQQDHHDLGRGHAGVEQPSFDRQGAVLGDAIARPGAALRALRGGLQLPDEQCASGHRPRAVARPGGPRERPAAELRLLPKSPWGPAGTQFHAGSGLRPLHALVDLCDNQSGGGGDRSGKSAAGAGGGEHRSAADLEADAPAADFPRHPVLRRSRVAALLHRRPVPPFRLEPDRARPRAGCSLRQKSLRALTAEGGGLTAEVDH